MDWHATRRELLASIEAGGGDAITLSNLSYAQLRCGDVAQALAFAEQALGRDVRLAAAWINRCAALMALGDLPQSVMAAREALALAPDAAETHQSLGGALRELGEVSGATLHLLEAVRLAPHLADAWSNLALALMDQGQTVPAADAAARACALEPTRLDLASIRQLVAQYHEAMTSAELRAVAASFQAALDAAGVRGLPAPAPRSAGPLRIGYLSPDLRAHPVGFMMRDVFAAHDAERTVVTLYRCDPRRDWLTEELAAQPSLRWCEGNGLDDVALAARIRADRIDVLVDLAGHTGGNRLGVMAMRAAPVQVSFLGWFASTGIASLDANLIGAHQLAPGHASFFVEPVRALPGTHFRFRPVPYAPPPAVELPSRRHGAITFGSFNNAAKLNSAVLQCWVELLHAVPDSRLWLQWKTLADPRVAATLTARFTSLGIAPERVLLTGACDHASMLQRYGEIDVALDPFPFPGGLTSLEALSQGVPVVTLAQVRPVSRQTTAILRALALDDLVAATPREYVAIATSLARDTARRIALRATLRDRMARSEVGEPASLAAALQSAFEALLVASSAR